jgi:hypothetical protein
MFARLLAVALVMLVGGGGRALAQVGAQPKVDSQAPSVTTRPERSQVSLGEPFHVTVTVLHPAKMLVNLPSTLNLSDAWAELGDRDVIVGTEPDGLSRTVFTLTVAALELGEQTFPAIALGYQVGGELRQLDTLPFSVEVASVVGKGAEELRPIAQPVRVFERDFTLVWVLGGLVVGGAAAVLLRSFVRAARERSPAARAAAEAARVLPPDEAALERLRALASSSQLDDDDRRPVYFALTEIVREYLGRRYGFDALELTSEELVARLPRFAPPEAAERLGPWLAACDLVKYARVPASRVQAEQAIAEAVALIESTRPRLDAPAPTDDPDGSASEAGAPTAATTLGSPPSEPASPVARPSGDDERSEGA